MDKHRSSFKVQLKVLTPLHIGSGETISKLDYFLEAGRCWRINLDTLFADPDFQPLREKFLESAPSGQPIDQLIPKELLKRHIRYKIPLHFSAQNANLIEVRLFTKSAGRVYIPGSSLKGAVLSALCYDILMRRPQDADAVLRRYSDPLGITLPELGGTGESKFTHWLDVSDSDFHSPEESLEIVQAKVTGARRGGQIPILYETLKPDTRFTFALKLDSHSRLTPENLFQKVGEFYRMVLAKDRLSIDTALSINGILIRLGQGSGMFATSLLLLAQDLRLTHLYRLPRVDTRIGPRTRKRIQQNIPMGWAELEVVK